MTEVDPAALSDPRYGIFGVPPTSEKTAPGAMPGAVELRG